MTPSPNCAMTKMDAAGALPLKVLPCGHGPCGTANYGSHASKAYENYG